MRLIIILVLVPIISFSRSFFIKDEFTLQPIKGAEVNGKHFSDIYGRVNVDTNAIDFVIKKFGYKTDTITFFEIQQLNYAVYLSPENFETEEVVVTATHWESNRQKVPIKISNIEQSKILIQNSQTAADLVSSSGEVFVQKSQLGGGSPMIRGFSTSRVLITVDGVRMNNAIFRSGNVHNIISIDPFTINRTELIFGPGSVLFGSDAIGGVMNFYTKDPTLAGEQKFLWERNIALRNSTANGESTQSYGTSIATQKLGLILNYTNTAFENQAMGSNGPDDYLRNQFVRTRSTGDEILDNADPEEQVGTRYEQMNLMGKLLYQATDNLSLKLSYMYSESSDIPRYDRLVRPNGDEFRSAEWYYGPQKWEFINFSSIYSKSNFMYDEAKLTLARQFFGESRNDRDFGSDFLRVRSEEVRAYSANLDFLKTFSNSDKIQKTELYYGAEIVNNSVGSNAFSKNIQTDERQEINSRYPDGSQWLSASVYANLRHDVSSELSLFSGARVNYIGIESDFDNTFLPLPITELSYNDVALNGSVGLAYRPMDDLQINANLSTGFRAPNIDDIGKVFDSEPGSVVIPNNQLSAEYAYNAELSIEKSFGESFKIDLTGYYTILQDALVRSNSTLNGMDSILYDGQLSQVQAVQNAESAVVYGTQAYAELRLPLNLAISTKLNIQIGESELEDGTIVPLRHAAPTFGKTVLKYQRDKLRLELYSEYSARFDYDDLPPSEQSKDFIYALDGNGLPYSPAWYTLNLKGLYRWSKTLLLTAGIENITDQRYLPYSSGIVAPGLNFIGSVKFNF